MKGVLVVIKYLNGVMKWLKKQKAEQTRLFMTLFGLCFTISQRKSYWQKDGKHLALPLAIL